MSIKIPVGENEPLQPGERVELHFNCPGPDFWKATLAAIIENALRSRRDFFIKSVDYLQDGKLIFEIEVLKTNPVIVCVAIIAAAIVSVGIVTWLVFDKAYKIVDTPAAINLSLAALVGVVIVLLMFLGKK